MRALRISLVVLTVLAGLFVAADRVAAHLAEEAAAEQVMQAEGLTGTESASVEIRGFPFLTQVLGKRLDEVDVRLTGMTAGTGDRQIAVTRVDAKLTDVHLGNGFSSATAERADGTAKISYEDLNTIAPDGVKVSYAGEDKAGRNQVRLTASLDILGRTVQFPEPIYSTVDVSDGDRVELHAKAIPGSDIPGAEGRIRNLVDFGSEVSGLPSGLTLDDAEVTAKGLTLTLGGEEVELAG